MSESSEATATRERIRVRYGETDQMGHAYYGNYALWFEQGRGAWCRDRGFTYKSLEERGILLPCVELHVRYKGEVRYDDWIAVEITLGEIRRVSMRFDYRIFNESQDVLTTEGYTWHVTMDSQTRRAVSVPEFVRELLLRDPAQFARLE
jgi:acyl-CoA thioester hydrolase